MMELRTENLVVGQTSADKKCKSACEIRRGSDIDRTKWSRKIYNIKNNNKTVENIGWCGVYRRYVHEQYAGQ